MNAPDRLRVLVGEDQPIVCEGIVRLLERGGFEVAATAADAPDLVRKARIYHPDVVVTDIQMPPDHTDDGLRAAIQIRAAEPRRLPEIQSGDPMIIVLAREAYSAKDQRQHEGLVRLWQEMKPGVGYCRMVTITTSDPQETYNYRSGVGAEWPFLADPGRVVRRDLDIAEYTDPVHDQMVPHTIVCAPGLVIYKIYNGYWLFGRPTVEELRMDLRAVLMKSHWDWDLSAPGVRAAWQRGEIHRFYPPELGWPPEVTARGTGHAMRSTS